MNFEDEDYFRLYTRDTTTWLKFGWEGQCVFALLGRKLDRVGSIDVGEDPVDDVAVVTGLPLEIVRVGLPRILARGTFVVCDGKLFAPRYIEAQTARKSDKLRAKVARDQRRQALIDGVTIRDAKGNGVTKRDYDDGGRDSESRESDRDRIASLSSLAEPSLADQNPLTPKGAESGVFPSEPGDPDNGIAESSGELDSSDDGETESEAEIIRGVFEFWKQEHGHPKAKLEKKRRQKIRARLSDGYTPRDLCLAIRGAKRDAFLMGANDRNTTYDDLTTLLRDGPQVEKLRDLTGRSGPGVAGLSADRDEFEQRKRESQLRKAKEAAEDASRNVVPCPPEVRERLAKTWSPAK